MKLEDMCKVTDQEYPPHMRTRLQAHILPVFFSPLPCRTNDRAARLPALVGALVVVHIADSIVSDKPDGTTHAIL